MRIFIHAGRKNGKTALLNRIKDLLGIKMPSKVFEEKAKDAAEEFLRGVDEGRRNGGLYR